MLAGRSSPFLGRERAAVDVDVGPERRSPHYHETCLALESVKEGSAAVSEPRCVWLRVHIFNDLEKARGLPVRVMMMLLYSLETKARRGFAWRNRIWSSHFPRFAHPVFLKVNTTALQIYRWES